MNDPITRLREQLPRRAGTLRGSRRPEPHAPDAVQMLTAKMLLVTGLGTAAEAVRNQRAADEFETPGAAEWGRAVKSRPTAWAPALLGCAAAVAHAVHAVTPGDRSRLATRTLDLAVVGIGLLSLAEGLAAARRNGEPPSVGAVSLASAGLLGVLLDRTEERQRAQRQSLERRASVVQRLVPPRRPRLDRIVVHV